MPAMAWKCSLCPWKDINKRILVVSSYGDLPQKHTDIAQAFLGALSTSGNKRIMARQRRDTSSTSYRYQSSEQDPSQKFRQQRGYEKKNLRSAICTPADFALSSQHLTVPSLPAVTNPLPSEVAFRHVMPWCALATVCTSERLVGSK